MMRAVEFASRLGFAITPDAYEAILDHRKEIAKSAPPRVTEELAQSLRGRPCPSDVPAAAGGRAARRPPAGARRRSCARSTRTIPTAPGTSSGRCSTSSTPSAAAAASFDDAVLFALLFLPIVRARRRARLHLTASPIPGGLATILEDIVTPACDPDGAAARRLPTGSSRRSRSVGTLSHRPDGQRRDAARSPCGRRSRSRSTSSS